MNKLDRLIRLQKLKVDQQRLFLQPLQQRVKALDHEVAMVHQHIKNEQAIALQSIEGTMAYGQYVQGMYLRLEKIQKFLKEAKLKLAQELERLQDMAARQKAYEKIQAQQRLALLCQQQKTFYLELEEKVPLHNVPTKRR